MERTYSGQTVHVTQRGDEGPARLFIHCSLGRSESLLPLAELLPPGRNMLFDLPGHGRSQPWTGADFHRDVTEIGLGLLSEPSHLIGHSFGATVALRIAGLYPGIATRLTLIEPVMFCAADPASQAAYIAQRAPFAEAWEAGDRAEAARVFLSLWGGAGPEWEEMPRRVQDQIVRQMESVVSAGLSIEEDKAGMLDKLTGVTCPVDLIAGGNSQPIMAAILDGLQARLPQAERHVIAGAGHMVPVSHPAEVFRVLDA